MRRKALLNLAAWTGYCLHAHAQVPFEFRELGGCGYSSNPDRNDGDLQVRRVGPTQVLLATVPLNCGARVRVTVEEGATVYVNVENVFVKGEGRAICNCMRRFEIALKKDVPSGTTIWLLGNGQGAARTKAE